MSARAVVGPSGLGSGPAQSAAFFFGLLLPGAIAGDYRRHRFRCALVYFGYDAGVDVAGEARLAVAEGFTNDLHGDAGGERQGG